MKTLEERQRAALSMSARLSDVEAVARDTRTAVEAARAEAEAQKAASLDLKLPMAEAKVARHAAADAELEAERHGRVLAELEAKAEALRASEANAARIAVWEAAAKERAALMAEIKDRWPKLEAEMVDLLSRMAGFSERAQLVNGDLPKGRKRLEPIEAEARGVPGHFRCPAGSPIPELLKMRLPSFNGPGYAWPDARPERERQAALDAQRQARLQREAREKMEAADRFKLYRITPPEQLRDRYVECDAGKVEIVRPSSIRMTAEQADAARTKGFEIAPLSPGKAMGMPSGVPAL